MELFFSLLLPFVVIFLIYFILVSVLEKKKLNALVTKLENNSLELSPKEFFELRNKTIGRNRSTIYVQQFNFAGIYILYNSSKNMYYIGQGKKFWIV